MSYKVWSEFWEKSKSEIPKRAEAEIVLSSFKIWTRKMKISAPDNIALYWTDGQTNTILKYIIFIHKND